MINSQESNISMSELIAAYFSKQAIRMKPELANLSQEDLWREIQNSGTSHLKELSRNLTTIEKIERLEKVKNERDDFIYINNKIGKIIENSYLTLLEAGFHVGINFNVGSENIASCRNAVSVLLNACKYFDDVCKSDDTLDDFGMENIRLIVLVKHDLISIMKLLDLLGIDDLARENLSERDLRLVATSMLIGSANFYLTTGKALLEDNYEKSQFKETIKRNIKNSNAISREVAGKKAQERDELILEFLRNQNDEIAPKEALFQINNYLDSIGKDKIGQTKGYELYNLWKGI